jgi:hypothetical protein
MHCHNANHLLTARPIPSVKPSDQAPRVLLLVSELIVALYCQGDENGNCDELREHEQGAVIA